MSNWHLLLPFILGGTIILRSLARPLRVAVTSDTRTLETDKTTKFRILETANHIVADRKIVIDDCEAIINAYDSMV